MALKVTRKEKEDVQNLIRRFTRGVQQSGLLIKARKSLFREKRKSEELKKRAALRREEKKREYERLKKIGKIPE